MAKYSVRVELNAASPQHYDWLHARMTAAGFTQTVRADDGRLFHLPPAVYVLDVSALTIDAVHRLAAAAVNSTGCSGEVLVDEVVRRSWSLKPVFPPEPFNALAGLAGAKLPSINALRPSSGLGALAYPLHRSMQSALGGLL